MIIISEDQLASEPIPEEAMQAQAHMSRSFLSQHISFSITLVKVYLCLINPYNFVPELMSLISVLFGKFQSGLPILIVND